MREGVGFVSRPVVPVFGGVRPAGRASKGENTEPALTETERIREQCKAAVAMGLMDVGRAYDVIASAYDCEYDDAKSLAENRILQRILIDGGFLDGDILDIGCGTGFLLDLFQIQKSQYLGVDPSKGMINHAREKHPQHLFEITPAEALHNVRAGSVDRVVSLFGPLNYSEDPLSIVRETSRVLRKGGKFLHMFYATKRQGKTYILSEDEKLSVKYYDKSQLDYMFSAHGLTFSNVNIFGMTNVLEKFRGASIRWGSLAFLVGRAEIALAGLSMPDSFQYLLVTGQKGS